ncbi:MAG: hypothetical protein JWN46_595 [Acidimicrobiales bacterium]|nr:hypothetical protein [Acidimicrobiales bacterium]
MGKRRGAVVVAACLLAACSGSKSTSSTPNASGATTSTTAAAAPRGCGTYKDNKGGVLRTFCDGSAKVQATAGGKTYTVNGGTCDLLGGYFNLNAGVVSGPDFKGSKPDYVGLLLPTKAGPFARATATVTVGGTGYALVENTGTHDSKSGEIHGTSYGDKVKVDVTFTC